MYLYIYLADLSHFTSTSGVTVSGTAEFSDLACDVCSGESFEVNSINRLSPHDGMGEPYYKYSEIDAFMVCLDCNNRFQVRQTFALL